MYLYCGQFSINESFPQPDVVIEGNELNIFVQEQNILKFSIKLNQLIKTDVIFFEFTNKLGFPTKISIKL